MIDFIGFIKGWAIKVALVIDSKGYLRIKLFYSLKTESNFPEILKLVEAIKIVDKQSKRQNGLQTVKFSNSIE